MNEQGKIRNEAKAAVLKAAHGSTASRQGNKRRQNNTLFQRIHLPC